MSLIESAAAFRQRCDEITTDGSLRVALDGQAIRTHSAMAFTMGTPQMTPTEDQFGALAQRVFGVAPSVGQMSAIRRVHFESTTLVISTIREKVTSEGAEKGDTTKKIPLAEKKQRRDDQLARLNGISMVGELDPSHALLDLANQMLESGVIIWLAPSKCSKRDDEAEWNSELKYQWCMMRRGLAFDQCRVLSWSVHQHWTNYMLNLMSRPVNPGFQQIKLDQLVRADRELWTLLAQEVSGSLKMDGNEIPLDKHVTRLATDPRVTMLLLPLPTNQRVTEAPDKPRPNAKAGPVRPAAKVSTKRKTRAERSCPEELKQYNTKVAAGQICWNYNMKDGCQLSTSGKPAKCSRGLHLCACCHKAGHSLVVCREAKKG
ncbi:unnamed protein product [Cladocopium goreaui]|uniref:Uncharacterized protein n=1 Tax=Cladocopium goreaui TaxID=2562237 RepID=A0A9P1BLR9_9DINO|nr:unnamed protein product [Cladocopium goreaui]